MMKTLLVLAFTLIVSPAYAWGDREQGALIGFAAGLLTHQIHQIHQNQYQLPRYQPYNYSYPNIYITPPSVHNHYILIRLFLTQSVNVTDRLLFNLVGDEGELKLFW